MLIDDLIDIFLINIGIPGSLRINHHDGTLFAAIEASGFVDSYFTLAVQVELFHAFLRVFLCFFCAAIGATGATIIALIDAEKNVMLIEGGIAHGNRKAKD